MILSRSFYTYYNFRPKPVPAKVTLNQMVSQSKGTTILNTPSTSIISLSSTPVVTMATQHPPPVSAVTGSSSTTVTLPSSKPAEMIQPLTDVFVPLESIQPCKTLFLTKKLFRFDAG